MKVAACIYSEGLSIDETAYVLRIGAKGVKSLLWGMTDKFCSERG